MHARCVSGGIEGDETVFESLNVQMDFGGKPPKLACQELKIQSKFFDYLFNCKTSQVIKQTKL